MSCENDASNRIVEVAHQESEHNENDTHSRIKQHAVKLGKKISILATELLETKKLNAQVLSDNTKLKQSLGEKEEMISSILAANSTLTQNLQSLEKFVQDEMIKSNNLVLVNKQLTVDLDELKKQFVQLKARESKANQEEIRAKIRQLKNTLKNCKLDNKSKSVEITEQKDSIQSLETALKQHKAFSIEQDNLLRSKESALCDYENNFKRLKKRSKVKLKILKTEIKRLENALEKRIKEGKPMSESMREFKQALVDQNLKAVFETPEDIATRKKLIEDFKSEVEKCSIELDSHLQSVEQCQSESPKFEEFLERITVVNDKGFDLISDFVSGPSKKRFVEKS